MYSGYVFDYFWITFDLTRKKMLPIICYQYHEVPLYAKISHTGISERTTGGLGGKEK